MKKERQEARREDLSQQLAQMTEDQREALRKQRLVIIRMNA